MSKCPGLRVNFSPEDVSDVAQEIANDFAPYDVEIVIERPAEGPYTMIVVTPTNNVMDGISGTGPKDCNNSNPNNIGFAYLSSESTQNANINAVTNKHTLNTDKLPHNKIYALCYSKGDGSATDTTWTDAGHRLSTPKVTAIKYSHPVRDIDASTCFGAIDLYGLANCRGGITGDGAAATGGSGFESIRNSIIPRAPGVKISYHGRAGYEPANGLYISLVEHTRANNNPCRDAKQAAALPDAAGGTDTRLHSGVMQAGATNSMVTIPQITGGATNGQLLDYDKTFALCYAEGDGTRAAPLRF